MLLVDTNILIDVVNDDPQWAEWSAQQLRFQLRVQELVINPVIYAELAPSFRSQQKLDAQVAEIGLVLRELPKDALYIAGVAHRHYRHASGQRQSILADFLIGAHAAVLGCGILTRDARRFRRYFPRVPLIAPDR